jgi:hypothetical protein
MVDFELHELLVPGITGKKPVGSLLLQLRLNVASFKSNFYKFGVVTGL